MAQLASPRGGATAPRPARGVCVAAQQPRCSRLRPTAMVHTTFQGMTAESLRQVSELGRRSTARPSGPGSAAGGSAQPHAHAQWGPGGGSGSPEDRRQQQRQDERAAREAAAAASSQALRAAMEQREREILAMAEEVAQLRHQWAAFSHQSDRHYGPQADADDCWGRGLRGAAAADSSTAQQQSGSARGSRGSPPGSSSSSSGSSSRRHAQRERHHDEQYSEESYWQDFADETADGFRYRTYAAGGSSSGGGYHGSTGSRSSRERGSHGSSSSQQQAPPPPPPPPRAAPAAAAVPAGGSLEQQVQAELSALLVQSGGDLVVLVGALGIPFERAPDRRGSLRNARTAALLRLHPDKLQQAGARQQAFGHAATTLVNELWRASN